MVPKASSSLTSLLLPLLLFLHVAAAARSRTSLNAGWRFSRFTSNPDNLSYSTLKPYMQASSNDFLSGTKFTRPSGNPPGTGLNYVQSSFDDKAWEQLSLPHDWAVKGPFNAPGVSGGMGRLPINGVGWYRKKMNLTQTDIDGKSLYMDFDGSMSYTAVWLNGVLVGGWPYGYASFRLDLTPYAKAGENILAVRVDNALDSSRWYPGAGIYRNVWLVSVERAAQVAQFGTFVTTPSVSSSSATVKLEVQVQNKAASGNSAVDVTSEVFVLDPSTRKPTGNAVATFAKQSLNVAAGAKSTASGTATVSNPQLWGPPPQQKPNQYVVVTSLSVGGTVVDTYETPFGIRTFTYDANRGLLVNGQYVRVQGTCNHHDLGSLGAAFNYRAAERQLQGLQEMGSNALRTSHNPPAPEFLELADRLGFLVLDEIFDCWAQAKTSRDFHLIFNDWREPDLRAFMRRDRNHPSIFAWSVGNEIPEQSDNNAGGAIIKALKDIARQEDSSRPIAMAMNGASPGSAVADTVDLIGLNYQGEGFGTSPSGSFGSFHSKYPNKLVFSSESSSVLSSRGTYLFPVTSANGAVVGNSAGQGGDASGLRVSSYELYHPSWGSSPDKVFGQHDRNTYVAGEFVWTGWDYIGEPTPYDSARSSYFGIIDMAGFKKDRFYLYQARWRSDFPMAHILPHWTWPDRVGQTTPVHVFSSGDEAELFVNGKSAGRQKKAQYTYRFRWDNVVYQPGDLRVVTYKNGQQWATDTKRTVGDAKKLNVTVDRSSITGDGNDLAFVSVAVVDANGDTVPRASNQVAFTVSGPGTIVSTDNGDPADFVVFPSTTRKTLSGLVMAIVKATPGSTGQITVTASSSGLTGGSVTISLK